MIKILFLYEHSYVQFLYLNMHRCIRPIFYSETIRRPLFQSGFGGKSDFNLNEGDVL